jgi:flagellar hook-basal body complex protein FliE
LNKETIPTTSIRLPQRDSEIVRSTGRSRYYVCEDEKVPSVTSVLNAVWPKNMLNQWIGRTSMAESLRQRMGEEITETLIEDVEAVAKKQHGQRKTKEAANLGSQAHDLISRCLKAESVDVPVELRTVMEAFALWQHDNGLTVVDSEVGVYRPVIHDTKPAYAGTIDALFTTDYDSLLLVDFKTGKDIYVDHLIQLESYRQALLWMNGYRVDIRASIVKLGKETADFEVFRLPDMSNDSLEPHAYMESMKLWWDTLDFYNSYKSWLKRKGTKL